MSNLRAFKTAFREAVMALSASPQGFTRADVGQRLGVEYSAPGKARARLGGYVERYVRDGLLDRVGRGRFRMAERFGDDDALGVGVQLERDIHDAFALAGGVMSMRSLLVEVDREGDSTLVRRILTESEDFISGSAFAGYKTAWRLVDAKRIDLPVPGALLAFELQSLTGGGRNQDMPRLLRERRATVGEALAEARDFAGLTIDETVSIPAIAAALDAALRSCDAPLHPVGGEPTTVSAWWRQELDLKSRRRALAGAWEELEAGEMLVSTTVRFWWVAGEAFKVSPSHLSRGCVAPLA